MLIFLKKNDSKLYRTRKLLFIAKNKLFLESLLKLFSVTSLERLISYKIDSVSTAPTVIFIHLVAA